MNLTPSRYRMTRKEQLDEALAILRQINTQIAALVARADGLTDAGLRNDNDRDTKEAHP